MDLRKHFVLHQDLGIGCDYIDIDRRYRKDTVFGKSIKIQGAKELLSEELRLLYVAITRAREKLYIVGVVPDYEEKVLPKQEKYAWMEGSVPFSVVQEANSYLDILLMSCPPESMHYRLKAIDADGMGVEEKSLDKLVNEVKGLKMDIFLRSRNREVDMDRFAEVFKPYAHLEQSGKFITMSVSELKRLRQRERLAEDQFSEPYQVMKDVEKPVPEFVEHQDMSIRGAVYGTMMHKVLSLLEPKAGYTYEMIRERIDDLVEAEILEREYRDKIYIKPLLEFTRSDIYQRIVAAYEGKRMYAEKPFVLGIDDGEDSGWCRGHRLVFEEDGELVLLDYKTDYVPEGDEHLLVDRYQVQMEYYRQALQEVEGKHVKEACIYSLSLGKTVRL